MRIDQNSLWTCIRNKIKLGEWHLRKPPNFRKPQIFGNPAFSQNPYTFTKPHIFSHCISIYHFLSISTKSLVNFSKIEIIFIIIFRHIESTILFLEILILDSKSPKNFLFFWQICGNHSPSCGSCLELCTKSDRHRNSIYLIDGIN